MHDMRALLDHGFRTWRENLNTCVPFIFRIVLMAVVVLVAMIPPQPLGNHSALYMDQTGKLLYEEAA